MNEESEILYKISKLKKENKNLQGLLESAENEMKSIVQKSQEESKQLQTVLQSDWPKLQNRLQKSNNCSSASTASVDRSYKSIQTDNATEWAEHLQELEYHLQCLERIASDLIKTQQSLDNELQTAKAKEDIILAEVSNNQQQILNLEIEISDYKKQLILMQDEFQVLYQHISYEELLGNPAPAIFLILNKENS